MFFANTNHTNDTNKLKFSSFSIILEILSRHAYRAPATYYVNQYPRTVIHRRALVIVYCLMFIVKDAHCMAQ